MHQIDVTDPTAMTGLAERHSDIDTIIHLAARAGVRYSLTQLKSLVYASSSSVYGARTKQPFSIEEPADHRVSIYAPTKRDDIVPAIVTAAETANPRAQRASALQPRQQLSGSAASLRRTAAR